MALPSFANFCKWVEDTFNLSQKLRQDINDFSSKSNFNINVNILRTLPEMYRHVINDFKTKNSPGYWDFSMQHRNEEEAKAICSMYPDGVISQEWRLVGDLPDLIELAKRSGLSTDLKLIRTVSKQEVTPCRATSKCKHPSFQQEKLVMLKSPGVVSLPNLKLPMEVSSLPYVKLPELVRQ